MWVSGRGLARDWRAWKSGRAQPVLKKQRARLLHGPVRVRTIASKPERDRDYLPFGAIPPCRGGAGPARKHDHRATNQTNPIIINASQTLTVRGSAHDRTNDHRVYETMCTATASGWIGVTVKLIALIAPIKAKQWKTLGHAANDRIAVIQLNYSTSKQQNRHTAINKIQYQAITATAAPTRRDENPARLTLQSDYLTN